jgi:hypothetical protein
MTHAEAIVIAEEHLRRHPFPDPECRWVIATPKQVGRGWLFPYRFERIGGDGELPPYAGAVGFLVRQDGTVDELSYSQWFDAGGE